MNVDIVVHALTVGINLKMRNIVFVALTAKPNQTLFIESQSLIMLFQF